MAYSLMESVISYGGLMLVFAGLCLCGRIDTTKTNYCVNGIWSRIPFSYPSSNDCLLALIISMIMVTPFIPFVIQALLELRELHNTTVKVEKERLKDPFSVDYDLVELSNYLSMTNSTVEFKNPLQIRPNLITFGTLEKDALEVDILELGAWISKTSIKFMELTIPEGYLSNRMLYEKNRVIQKMHYITETLNFQKEKINQKLSTRTRSIDKIIPIEIARVLFLLSQTYKLLYQTRLEFISSITEIGILLVEKYGYAEWVHVDFLFKTLIKHISQKLQIVSKIANSKTKKVRLDQIAKFKNLGTANFTRTMDAINYFETKL